MENIVLIVEGQSDINKIQSIYPNLKMLKTDGSSVSEKFLAQIKSLSEKNKIVIFTDPDYPGLQIRDKISRYLNNKCYHVFIDKIEATKNSKVGVAEANIESIKKALANIVKFDPCYKSLEWVDYIEIVDSKDKREKLIKHYKLGQPNNKRLYKLLNYMGLDKEDIIEVLGEKYGKEAGKTSSS